MILYYNVNFLLYVFFNLYSRSLFSLRNVRLEILVSTIMCVYITFVNFRLYRDFTSFFSVKL